MDERSIRVERAFALPGVVAALLTIPVLVIENSAASGAWHAVGVALNWLTWLFFLVESVTMLVIVPDRRGWIRRHWLDVALVVLTPPVLPPGLQWLRVLRLLRLLRLYRVARFVRGTFSPSGLPWALGFALLTVVAGAAVFESVEPERSFWDGVWWAVVTLTTVGYGDINPTTTTGRIVGIAVMVVGVGVFALLTGAVAQRFLASSLETAEEGIEHAIDSVEDEIAAEMEEIRRRLDRLEALVTGRSA